MSSTPKVYITPRAMAEIILILSGHTYSGRGKYLLNCASVSIVHTPEWIEPHTHLFASTGPGRNIIEVKRDWKDLDKQIRRLLRNPDEAQIIAKNSVKTFRNRYLTPAAQACYWRRMFHAWATVSFEPTLYHTIKDETTGRIFRKIRGTPFESYVSTLLFPPDPRTRGSV
jgi:hypothetical protein